MYATVKEFVLLKAESASAAEAGSVVSTTVAASSLPGAVSVVPALSRARV